MEVAAFVALGLAAVVSGMLVFRVDSMARATFLLLASFLFVAGTMLLLDLHYLAALTVLMMTVEMAVMVVFMLMYMMNPAGLMPMTMVHNRRGALGLSVGTFVVLASGAVFVPWPDRSGQPPTDATRQLGESIMEGKMLVMLVVGVSLFATMVAATVLATSRGRYDRYGDELQRPRPDDPVQGGVGP